MQLPFQHGWRRCGSAFNVRHVRRLVFRGATWVACCCPVDVHPVAGGLWQLIHSCLNGWTWWQERSQCGLNVQLYSSSILQGRQVKCTDWEGPTNSAKCPLCHKSVLRMTSA